MQHISLSFCFSIKHSYLECHCIDTCSVIWGVIHIWRSLSWKGGGWGAKAKMRCYRSRGLGVSECSERPVFIFLLKKIGFVLWPDIILSQTLTYYIVRKRVPSPPLLKPPTPWLSLPSFLNLCFPLLFSVPPPFKVFQTIPPPWRNPHLP